MLWPIQIGASPQPLAGAMAEMPDWPGTPGAHGGAMCYCIEKMSSQARFHTNNMAKLIILYIHYNSI